MTLLIMCAGAAESHVPERMTYAIRIINSYPGSRESLRPLKKPELFVERVYTFDDQDMDTYERWGIDTKGLETWNVLFNPEIARSIIGDFRDLGACCLDWLIHCEAGVSRSPAVAIALAEHFNLGVSAKSLKRKHSAYNRFVYRLMKGAMEG